MARDVAVRLIVTGSQQAREVLSNFSRDLKTLEAQGNALQKAGVAKQNQLLPIQGLGQGTNLGALRQELRTTADTFKLINTATVDFGGSLGKLEVVTVDYTGSVQGVLRAQKDFAAALEVSDAKGAQAGQRIAALTTQYEALIAVQNRAAASAQQRIGIASERITAADTAIAVAAGNRDASARTLENLYTRRASGELPVVGGNLIAAAEADLAEKNKILADVVATETKARSAAQGRLSKAESDLTAATEEAARLQTQLARRTGGIQGAAIRDRNAVIAAGEASIAAAYQAPPPVPAAITQIRQNSPALLKRLQQAGLGAGAAYGTPEFISNLQNQGAYESVKIQGDLVRQVTRVTGSFVDQKGVLQSFSAEYDKAGRVITRFGSSLSGIGNVISQLARDFQKVIEFAIATTAVFGAFQYAIKEIGTIREIDKGIRQLSVTANLTRPEAVGLFQDIANIAISTATPLNELVKATDDIALATKRAGQSTTEWRAEILSLTQSVGILTNLAGIDTVEATDQLVATMKQLNLQATDLPNILNKVTAVAGGQSNAIADVIKGLSVLAEAGQQANLTIDQMIATVQTLSQVTSKSPAEVATALKQLIGALGGPAGAKALAQYNIALRDSSGNLRNIIDIYTEISDKINKGVIPTADVQGLVRAIAGGPRRAPDAAALLSSIGQIAGVTEKSINATNEALIANAKILDTAQAKFTQLQVAIDKFATTKFADVLNDAAGSLAKTLTQLLDILDAIPTGVYTGIIQFGLLAAAVKLGGSIFNFFKNSVLGVLGGLKELVAGLEAAAVAQRNLSEATSVTTTTLGATVPKTASVSRFPGLAGKIGTAATLGAIAGGLTAASGANAGQAIGTGIQATGLGLLLAPEPTGITKALGLAAIIAGTGIQILTGDVQKNTDALRANNEEKLNAIKAFKDASDQAQTFAKAQKDASDQIVSINANTEKTADQQNQLTTATQNYVDATLGLIAANKEVSRTYDDLLTKLPGIASRYKELAGIAKLNPNSPEIKAAEEQITRSILEASGQVLVNEPKPLNPTLNLGRGGTSTLATLPSGQQIDLKDLVNSPDVNILRQLFTSGTRVTGTGPRQVIQRAEPVLPQNTLAATYLQQVLAALKDQLSSEDFNKFSNAIQTFAESVSSFDAASIHFTQLQGAIQTRAALGLLNTQQLANENVRATLGQNLAEAAKGYTPTISERSRGGFAQNPAAQANILLNQLASQELTGKPVAIDDLIKAQTLMLKLTNATDGSKNAFEQLKGVSQAALNDAIYEGLKNAGVAGEELDSIAKRLGISLQVAAQQATEIADAFNAAAQNAAKTYSDRALQLIIAQNSGEYDKNAKGLAILNAQNEQAYRSNLRVISSLRTLSSDSYLNLNNALSQTIGLQGTYLTQNAAENLTADQFAQRLADNAQLLIANAVAAGVNAEGIKKIEDELVKTIGLITAIPAYKQVIIDVTTVYSEGGKTGTSGAKDPRSQQALVDALKKRDEAIKNGTDPTSAGEQFAKDYLAAIEKGLGSKLGQLPKAGAGNKLNVSTLDIPDELKKLNQQGLLSNSQLLADINKAYQNAVKLQHQIPGYDKEAKNDIVAILEGTKKLAEFRGVKEELLRKALEELADIEKARLEFETKADTISRIRVGAGSFAGLVNVPLNSKTGVSVGGPNGPITVNLNINGQVLTPAQFAQLADQIGAAIKSQL